MTTELFKQHLMNNLIPFWNRMQDPQYGGFYGEMTQDLTLHKTADKGVILNSRILWFYSTAYQVLDTDVSGNPSVEPSFRKELLSMADHAYQFLKNACLDKEYGGIYWSMTYDGKPSDTTKHSYNQAFAIYALSAYYLASHNKEALDIAYSLYELLESKCRDKDGYLEAFHRDFSPASNEKLSENGVLAERTMNTLLHVLEAYSELYRADASPKVATSIREALDLFHDKIYNPQKQICEVFFDKDYHSLIDLESFGHDIEASWLIDRACEVLKDDSYHQKMQPIIDGLAEAAYRNAYDQKLHALNNERENTQVDCRKIWWVQAESVVGFYNAYTRSTSSEAAGSNVTTQTDSREYLAASQDIWEFIQTHLVDKRCGEWFESLQPDNSVTPGEGIVHAWKCPYHNGRMCLEMITRLTGSIKS